MAAGCVADLLILIPAAGAASRMRGGDKLLEQVAGEPQLRRIARFALTSSCPVRVVLPPDRPLRAAALHGLAVEIVVATDAAAGMSASLRAGVAGWAGAVMILPADMPEIDMKMIAQIIDIHHEDEDFILRGASLGHPGHPVLLPADLAAEIAGLTGDEGARSILARHRARLRLVDLPGRAALTDLDTPEDWLAWRSSQDG